MGNGAAMRLLSLTVTVLAATILLTACGEESDEEQIEGTIATFFEAVEEEDVAKFCSVVITDPPEGQTCEDELSPENFASTDDFEGIDINDIEVDGDTAIVTATAEGDDTEEQVSLRKLDGEWKIDFGD